MCVESSYEFEMTISIQKTNVIGQDIIAPPSINADNVSLDVVDQFTSLGSTITSNVSVDVEINMRCSCRDQTEQESVKQHKFNRKTPNYLFTRHVSVALSSVAVRPAQRKTREETE